MSLRTGYELIFYVMTCLMPIVLRNLSFVLYGLLELNPRIITKICQVRVGLAHEEFRTIIYKF